MTHRFRIARETRESAPLDFVSSIIAYENGELTDDEAIALFQGLIDCGLVWQLQGSYGRTAVDLIDAGLCNSTRKDSHA